MPPMKPPNKCTVCGRDCPVVARPQCPHCHARNGYVYWKTCCPEHSNQARAGTEPRKKGILHTDATKLKISRAKQGKAMRTPLTREGETHHTAVHAVFKDPRDLIRRVDNVTHFVRTHPELFHPEDARFKWYGKDPATRKWSCRAANGLRHVYGGKNGVWKGWTLVTQLPKLNP